MTGGAWPKGEHSLRGSSMVKEWSLCHWCQRGREVLLTGELVLKRSYGVVINDKGGDCWLICHWCQLLSPWCSLWSPWGLVFSLWLFCARGALLTLSKPKLEALGGLGTMTKALVTHWLAQVPLSCILVPFESIVEFLTHGWYLVTSLCAACYACTCLSLLIGCWMDDVAHVCKVFDVLMVNPIACIGWSWGC